MEYQNGFKQGQTDYADNLFPNASRLWGVAYRNGYSDGYRLAQVRK